MFLRCLEHYLYFCKIPEKWWLFRTFVCKTFHIKMLITSSKNHRDVGFAGLVKSAFAVLLFSLKHPVASVDAEFIGAYSQKSLKPGKYLFI